MFTFPFNPVFQRSITIGISNDDELDRYWPPSKKQ